MTNCECEQLFGVLSDLHLLDPALKLPEGAFSVGVGERIDVVKTGAGTLTVSGAALANACNLTVAAGKVVFTGNSTTFGTVTVAAGATLDTTGIRFTCANLVRMPGATILPPEATVMTVR